MLIDTGYDIGQVVWGVARDWSDETVACEACSGAGERTIPGTDIAVECRACDGDGSATRDVHRYYVVERAITDITIYAGRYRKIPEFTFTFASGTVGTGRFFAIAGDREAATIEARRLAEKDEFGRLHPADAAREETP